MKAQWVAQSLLNSSEKQTNHFQCATDSNNHNLVIGCSKGGVFILTLKWRKKPFLPRKKVCDSTNRPYTPGRWFISDNNGVSNSEFSPWAEPFLALLQQRKVFLFPATPENICQNTELVAVFSWNKCCFFVNSPGGRDKFWRITYSWAQSSHSGSSDNRKFALSTQRPLRMNVFALTLGETSSAGLDLLSLCTSNEMG